MRTSKKLIAIIGVIVIIIAMLPYTVFADSQNISMKKNYLFRHNTFKITAGETTYLEYTPQYTADYTASFKGYVNAPRNILAGICDSEKNTILDCHYGTQVDVTYHLDKGTTYYFYVKSTTETSTPTVDVYLSSTESGTLASEMPIYAWFDKMSFETYSTEDVYDNLRISVVNNNHQSFLWNRSVGWQIDGVDVIADVSGCGNVGINTATIYYMGYQTTAQFTVTGPTSTTTTTTTTTTTQPTTTTTTTTTTTQPATTAAPLTTATVATTKKSTVSKPKSTTIKKLLKGKKQFKITYKKISGVTGYQVQYSTSKKFTKKTTKTVKIKGSKNVSKTVKKLKSKKKYYVRVRTYKTVNKSTKYSSWTKTKTVKTK